MKTSDFTTTLLVDQSPKAAFKAITNIRGWWSEEVEGGTEKLNDEFTYHYEDLHYCKMKLIEIIPDKKVVWFVLDNHFNFTEDEREWRGTKIIFEITLKDSKTQILFTHQGLVPEYECFEICRDAWTNYIQNSLRDLIVTGKGQPNPKGGRNSYQEGVSKKMKKNDFVSTITVDATAREVFESVNNVTKWWTENLEGHSHKLNDEFTVRFGDVHVSKQRLIEIIPDKKVVWLITESKLNFLKDKQEWTGTKISFDISEQGNKTQLRFTHFGLLPGIECFDDCSNAWSQYIQQSLKDLINTGTGQPTPKEVKKSAVKS